VYSESKLEANRLRSSLVMIGSTNKRPDRQKEILLNNQLLYNIHLLSLALTIKHFFYSSYKIFSI